MSVEQNNPRKNDFVFLNKVLAAAGDGSKKTVGQNSSAERLFKDSGPNKVIANGLNVLSKVFGFTSKVNNSKVEDFDPNTTFISTEELLNFSRKYSPAFDNTNSNDDTMNNNSVGKKSKNRLSPISKE